MFVLTPLAIAAAAFLQPQLNALEHFFSGRTEGRGTVRILLSGTSQINSQGRGRVLPDGTLVLEHVVRQQGEPERRRTWRMRRVSTGRYTGTISDARGPVTAEIQGNRFHVTYRTQEGHNVDQWITFNGDGRTATNRMTFTRLGITIARVEERITRTGD